MDLNIDNVSLNLLSCNTAVQTQLNSIKNSPCKEILSKSIVLASHDNREARALLHKRTKVVCKSLHRKKMSVAFTLVKNGTEMDLIFQYLRATIYTDTLVKG